ncbi:hypothetical protein RB653_000991 [Dictyostelium firmibasis]|uniref:Exocyst complex component Sec8 n=1 Tax=Dictyostelium firmibasis TaxID=79012 RepID=A0AAN7TW72_9MYCE
MDDNEEKKLDENKISKVLSSIPEQYHKTSFQARRTALDYMRSSNRKELLNQIGDWLDEVNVETDNIVDVYFQGFNKSIHNYSRILEFMGSSHVNALSMSKEVEEINKLINFNGMGIDRLWKRNLEYYYMIEILEKMEELKKVPDLLNKYIKGNHFVHAANILVNSIAALNERDLVNVNALLDLRQMLVEKKESFKDMLVEKLNDHIYLKTKSSLKAFEYDDENNLQSNFKKILLSNKNSNINSNSNNNASNTPKLPNTASPFKPQFSGAFQTKASQEKAEKAAANLYNQERLSQSNQPEVLKLEEISKASNSKEDLNIDPEQDGKLFMTLLVEALNVLEYLSPAVGLILGRISIELKSAIINSTTLITNVYHSEGRVIPKMPGESSSSTGSAGSGSGNGGNGGNGGSGSMNGSGGMNGNGSSSSSIVGGNGLSPSVISKNNIGGATFSNIDEHSAAFNFLTETFNRNDLLANQTHNIPLVDLLKMIFNKVNMVFKNHLQLSKIFNDAIRKSELKIRSNKFDFKDETEGGDSDNDMDGTPKTIIQKPKVEAIADVYDASLVWEIIQKEIREMLRVHLQDTSSLLLSTKSRLNPDGTESSSGKSQRLFSFTNSIVTDNWNGSISPMITTSPASPNGSTGVDGTESNSVSGPAVISIFKASQYNVTPIYPMIVKFTDHLDKTLRDRTGVKTISSNSNSGKKGLLRLYIDDFVHRNFLQHIKNDYKDRFAHSIESTEAFKPLERYKLVFRLKETKPILNSTLQIFQFVIELFSDIVAMSHYVVEFGAIIQVSLLRYYEKCLNKFNQEIDPTLTNQLMSTDLYKYLLASLAVSTKKQEVAKFQDSREEEYEFKLESDLFNHPEKPVGKNQLILNIEKLTMLANMSHSLNWLADKIVQLLIVQDDSKENKHSSSSSSSQQQQQQQQQQSQSIDSNIKTPLKVNSGGSNGGSSGGTPTNINSMNSGGNTTNTAGGGSNNFISVISQMSAESIEALKTMEEPIKDIAQRFKDLSKRCLLALRIEYRIHCFYFLEGFKRAQYMCEEERTDPDSFIVELNKDLSASEEMMSIYLTSDKCNFLFSGIAKLIGKLLISKLVHVNSINDNGVAKLCKNVFTLQQNLSNIIVKREIFFDRIRQFYQALSAEDELLNYLLEKMSQPFFSLEEGKIIIDFLQRTKRISPNAISTLEAKYKNM